MITKICRSLEDAFEQSEKLLEKINAEFTTDVEKAKNLLPVRDQLIRQLSLREQLETQRAQVDAQDEIATALHKIADGKINITSDPFDPDATVMPTEAADRIKALERELADEKREHNALRTAGVCVGKQYRDLEEKVSALQATINQKDARIGELTGHLERAAEAFAEEQIATQADNDEIKSLRGWYDELQAECDARGHKIAGLEGELRQLKDQAGHDRTTIKSLNLQIEGLHSDKHALSVTKSSLAVRVSDLQRQLKECTEGCDKSLDQQRLQIDGLAGQLNKLNDALGQRDDQIATMREDNVVLSRRNDALNEGMQTLDGINVELRTNKELLEQKTTKLEEELATAHKEIKFLNDAHDLHVQNVESALEAQASSHCATIESLRQDIVIITSDRDALRSEKEQLLKRIDDQEHQHSTQQAQWVQDKGRFTTQLEQLQVKMGVTKAALDLAVSDTERYLSENHQLQRLLKLKDQQADQVREEMQWLKQRLLEQPTAPVVEAVPTGTDSSIYRVVDPMTVRVVPSLHGRLRATFFEFRDNVARCRQWLSQHQPGTEDRPVWAMINTVLVDVPTLYWFAPTREQNQQEIDWDLLNRLRYHPRRFPFQSTGDSVG